MGCGENRLGWDVFTGRVEDGRDRAGDTLNPRDLGEERGGTEEGNDCLVEGSGRLPCGTAWYAPR